MQKLWEVSLTNVGDRIRFFVNVVRMSKHARVHGRSNYESL